jgi:hypothetical protein
VIGSWKSQSDLQQIHETRKNAVSNKAMVIASGHICGRWRKELVQPSSISEDHDLDIRDTSSPEFMTCEMTKSQKHLLNRHVVTA